MREFLLILVGSLLGVAISFSVFYNEMSLQRATTANAQGAVDVMKLVCPKMIEVLNEKNTNPTNAN